MYIYAHLHDVMRSIGGWGESSQRHLPREENKV